MDHGDSDGDNNMNFADGDKSDGDGNNPDGGSNEEGDNNADGVAKDDGREDSDDKFDDGVKGKVFQFSFVRISPFFEVNL